jgi:vacuolar protein sorting-associated protein 13A/C
MDIELDPLDGRADYCVGVRMRPLEVVFNPVAIRAVIGFFTQAKDSNKVGFSDEQMSALRGMAMGKLQGVGVGTRMGLEHAIEEHKTLDLKIDIDAPIFVFPENCIDPKSIVVVLDAGHFLVESQLADKEVLKEIAAKKGEVFNESDMGRLTSLLYDRFSIEMSSVQVCRWVFYG